MADSMTDRKAYNKKYYKHNKMKSRSRQQADRLKLVYPKVCKLDHWLCRAPWIENTGNLIDDRLELVHIIGRSVRHPEYDEEWNLIILRKFIHDMFDGRRKNFMDIDHKRFQVFLLEDIFKVLQSNGLDREIRWQKALDYKIQKLGVTND